MENIKLINKFLESNYGRSSDNKPKFRVVWSEDLTEVRRGIFHPLQVIETIERRPKYSYIKDKFILEFYTLAFPEIFGRALQHSKDTIMSGDNYEPLRVFMTKKREYIKPDIEICKLFCDQFIEMINRPEGRRLTNKIATYDDVEAMRKEIQKFEDMLNADDSDLLQKFRYQEAVVLPGKDFS
jgi:hypothetical protein